MFTVVALHEPIIVLSVIDVENASQIKEGTLTRCSAATQSVQPRIELMCSLGSVSFHATHGIVVVNIGEVLLILMPVIPLQLVLIV